MLRKVHGFKMMVLSRYLELSERPTYKTIAKTCLPHIVTLRTMFSDTGIDPAALDVTPKNVLHIAYFFRFLSDSLSSFVIFHYNYYVCAPVTLP